MTRVLLAGDHFVHNDLLRTALEHEAGYDLDVRELVLPWPLEPFGPVAEVEEASGTEDQMIDALRDVDICLTQMGPITKRVLTSTPSLRLVCVGRGGPVNVNVPAAASAGVAVTFAPGRNATATAEHTVALMLAAMRSIPQRDAELRAGQWRSDYYQYDEVGPELHGATVGIVGFGAIGRGVAAIVRGFGADVVVFDPFADDVALDGVAVRADSLDELLAKSVVVTLHARATAETRGMIGRQQVQSMRSGSILINAARGSLVDYDAVGEALHVGQLAAAAFDVFPTEPLPSDSPLFTAPNVVMTPHLAGASKETARNAAAAMAAETGRFLRGDPLVNVA